MPFTKIIDVDAVKQVLQLWMEAVINPDGDPTDTIGIIQDWQAGPKPNKPFVSYRIIGPEKPAITEDVLYEQGDGGLYLEGQRVYHVEVEAFADADDETANELITALISSFEQPQFYYIFELGGSQLPAPQDFFCSVATVGEPTDVTTPLDTKFERRTLFEFDLIVNSKATMAVDQNPGAGRIQHVDTHGTATDGVNPDLQMDVKADV